MTVENRHESIELYEIQTGYVQHRASSAVRDQDEDGQGIVEGKGCITKTYEYLKSKVKDPVCWWCKCHWTGKIVASICQFWVLGDVVSDLLFLSSVFGEGKGWWIFYSILILYLSLRFTLVFTLVFTTTFEKTVITWITQFNWDNQFAQRSLGTVVSLFIPGAWQFVLIRNKIRENPNEFETTFHKAFYIFTAVMRNVLIEFIIVPVCVLTVSPFVLFWHVVQGTYGLWRSNSVSFYGNSFELQTLIFYSTIASLFETITESLPQFLLQSWIYFHSQDLIPAVTYYISVGFSLFNILKATIVFISMRRELIFSTIRLGNDITTEDDICVWNGDILTLKLRRKSEDCIIVMVQHFSNYQIYHLDVSWTVLTDDGLKEIVKHLRQLKSMNLNCAKIPDQGIKTIVENCYQLNTLDLYKVSISDEGFKAIAENCRQLITLNLLYTSVTDEHLLFIADNCLELKSIILCGTRVTDSSVTILLSKCKQLSKLHLPRQTFNYDLTDIYLQRYPKLRICIS